MTEVPEKLENVTFGSGNGPFSQKPAGIELRPNQRLCGDVGLRIDSEGTWHYQGSSIRRHSLVKLFASVLKRDHDGAYWLITPAEVAPIYVEDAPFLCVEMATNEKNGRQVIRFRNNIDAWITLGEERPLRIETASETDEPRPYLRIADDGTEARLVRSVFYQLVECAFETDINGMNVLCIESDGTQFVLGPTEAEE